MALDLLFSAGLVAVLRGCRTPGRPSQIIVGAKQPQKLQNVSSWNPYMFSSLPHLSRNPSLLTGHTTLLPRLYPQHSSRRQFCQDPKADQIHHPRGPETAVAYQLETAKYLGVGSSTPSSSCRRSWSQTEDYHLFYSFISCISSRDQVDDIVAVAILDIELTT